MGKSTLHKHGPIWGNEKGDIAQNALRNPHKPTAYKHAEPSPAHDSSPEQLSVSPAALGIQTWTCWGPNSAAGAHQRQTFASEGSTRLIGLS